MSAIVSHFWPYNKIIMIEYQLPREMMKYSKYLSYPRHFYATQIINPFLNYRISANHDIVEGHSVNIEILIHIDTLL